MSVKKDTFVQAGYLLFLFIVLLLINVSSAFWVPVRASLGGQWARRVGRDFNFYPATRLSPYDAIFYALLFLAIVQLMVLVTQKKIKFSIGKLYMLLGVLPLAWLSVTVIGGFNYHRCNLPSTYFVCHNPTPKLIRDIGIQFAAFMLSLLVWYVMIRKIKRAKS